MKLLLLTPIFKRFKKSSFFSSLNQNTCPVYDAEEIKKQAQQEAIKTVSEIFKASAGSLSLFIPNIQVQAPTPNALAIQSSFPISLQGNLKDSSIFFRSYPFSPSGKPAWAEKGNNNNIAGRIKLFT